MKSVEWMGRSPKVETGDGGVALTFTDRRSALEFVHKNWVGVGEWCIDRGWQRCEVRAENWPVPFDLRLSNYLRWKHETLEGEFFRHKEKVMELLQSVLMPGVQFGNIAMTGELWDLLQQFKEDTKFCGGLVRQRDEAQLAMTLTSQAICSIPLTEAVNKKREDYWHLPSLEKWRNERRSLEAGNPNSKTDFTWYSNGFQGVNREPQWKKITNEYRLVLDANGVPYELSRNKSVEYVGEPPMVV